MVLAIIGAVIVGVFIGFTLCALSAREVDRNRVKSGMMMCDNVIYKLTIYGADKVAEGEN